MEIFSCDPPIRAHKLRRKQTFAPAHRLAAEGNEGCPQEGDENLRKVKGIVAPLVTKGGVIADTVRKIIVPYPYENQFRLNSQVGLGKTAQVIALVCATLPTDKAAIAGASNRRSHGTLVVTPSHLSSQWHREILKFTGTALTVSRSAHRAVHDRAHASRRSRREG
jgi:hypothetical protein